MNGTPKPTPLIELPLSEEIKQPPVEEGNLAKEVEKINKLMMGVVIALFVGFVVMFVAFGTIIWSTHIWSADIYRGFIDKLNESNDRNELLLEKIKSLESYETTTPTGTILPTSP